MRHIFLLLFLLTATAGLGQSAEPVRIDSLPPQGILLDKGWKWHAGDNPDWAKPEFDDSKWESIDPSKEIYYLPELQKESVGWLRIHLQIDSTLLNKPLAFQLSQTAASELFLNGILLQRFGTVSRQPERVKAFNPINSPSGLLFDQTNQVLAVRFSVQRGIPYHAYNDPFHFFRFRISEVKVTNRYNDRRTIFLIMNFIYGGLFFLLGLIHLGFFIAFSKRKANVYFSCFAFSSSIGNILYVYAIQNNSIIFKAYAGIIDYIFLISFSSLFLLLAMYSLFPRPKKFIFWFLVVYLIFGFIIYILYFRLGLILGFLFPYILTFIEIFMVALAAYRNGKKGAEILVFGTAGYTVLYLMFFLMNLGVLPTVPIGNGFFLTDAFYHASVVCISMSFSIYLAKEFAFTSKDLEKKLDEVQQLSAEKQQILATQNETLEKQVDERTAELEYKNRELVLEAALEKVRARSLAMLKSTELRNVVSIVVERMIEIGLNIASANIVLFDDQSKDLVIWTKTNKDDTYSRAFSVPYIDDPAVADYFDAFESRANLFTKSYTFEEKNHFWQVFFERSDFRHIPADRKKFILEAEHFSISLACQKNTAIQLTRYTREPFSETDNEVLKRFATVFEQAYTRFLDLQKAESQALEVLRRTTVDRVRAEIASMRTTGDLERITPLIWNELTTLGVPFVRCGVFIMDEEHQQIHTFLSSPDGKAIASFNTPFSNPGLLTEVLPHWRNKEIYKTHWDEATFLTQAQTLFGQGAISSPETYLTENRPTSLYLHLLPFLQGMLYVGSDTAPLTNDQLSLVQTLAEAFSTAYARYEDFNQLEVAKQQVETAFSELKATQAQLVQKEKMASLGELTAGIAHEIQNPLNFVNNFSEVSTELVTELEEEQQKTARDPELEAELLSDLKQNLQKITQHGQRASSIVKGMLEHSRTSTGEKQPTDLNALADEYLRLAYQGLRAKDKAFNCHLVTTFDTTLPQLDVVPQEIGRVLLNLFNNAFYAVQQRQKDGQPGYQPTVTVTTKRTEDGVEIIISDNGLGIPDGIRDKIFQPFFTTKPTGQGTGLGLSLSYDIITKGHSGSLTLETSIGHGTTFTIRLPGGF